MRTTTLRSTFLFTLSSAAIALAISTQVLAASTCKALEQEVCETTEDCRWQAGYTRKDGIEVSSHCRSSGKMKAVSPEVSVKDGAEKAS
ncbi:MAG: hypothetical protein LJE61_12270 [Thiocapsa sp.]|jgi:hypothetical protein|nr:hypothetical protein [Thiocapsa sp.]MCG6985958.1 hypothetical protein [Thiocapsa sp.]